MKVMLDGGDELISIHYSDDFSFEVNRPSHGFITILNEQKGVEAYFNMQRLVGIYRGNPEIELTRNLYGKDEK